MYKLLKRNKGIVKVKVKGFSLMEMVVTIAIFGMVSLLISNIIISVSRFALMNDQRNDILSELDNLSITFKNDLRSSNAIIICGSAPDQFLVMESVVGASITRTKYARGTSGSTGVSNIFYQPMSIAGTMDCSTGATGGGQVISTPAMYDVRAFSLSYSSDNGTSGTDANSLVYITMDICDGYVFPCSATPTSQNNMYRYMMSVGTRNIRSI